MRLPTFGREKRIEPDIPLGAPDESQGGWAQVRNPALGAWQITVRRRIVWGVMATALPISLLALAVSWVARGSASEVSQDIERVESEARASGQWRPRHKLRATESAAAFAEFHGYDTPPQQIDDLDQLRRYGADIAAVVGLPPASALSSQDWGQHGLLERYVYLLSGPQHQEVLSFFIAVDSGEASLPTIAPVVEPEAVSSTVDLNHEEWSAEIGEFSGLAAFERFAGLFAAGAASSAWRPPNCQEAGLESSLPLTERVRSFVTAYTARDAETLASLANSGATWPMYPRIGWRALPETAAVICANTFNGEGIAQIWWLVESTGPNSSYRAEIRDVHIRDVEGLWSVYGAGPLLSGGFIHDVAALSGG